MTGTLPYPEGNQAGMLQILMGKAVRTVGNQIVSQDRPARMYCTLSVLQTDGQRFQNGR